MKAGRAGESVSIWSGWAYRVPAGTSAGNNQSMKRERTRRTKSPANIWRPSRIRNLLISPTYRGEHHYGKRSKRGRDPIVRSVPPIVDMDTWERAQATLRRNLPSSPRAAKRQYLLRSLIRCGTCGLSFTGKGIRITVAE